jgi:hypothetical protein
MSASIKSACGSGSNPRAAARRAAGGAVPEMIDRTTGFVEVTFVVMND